MGDDTELMREEEAFKLESTNTIEDIEIEPLLGKPYFHVTICKTHVCRPHQLNLPSEITPTLPHKNVPVTLTHGKRSWETTYNGANVSHKRFDVPSWKEFAADNSLKIGDVCLFELLSCTDTDLKFKVQVLRGDCPFLDTIDGGSFKNPIVVD